MISIEAEVAHCPVAGVNVKVVVATVLVLIAAGLHAPVIPLVELVGKTGAIEFWHSVPN